MKKFAYVLMQTISGIPSFHHLLLDVQDENEAYRTGYKTVKETGHLRGGPFSEYVFEVK